MMGDPRYLRAAGWCVLLALFFLSLLVIAGCATTTRGRLENVGVGISAAADYATTRQAITSGRGAEGNPLMQGSAAQQAAMKAASSAAIIWLAHALEQRGHERWAHGLRWVTIGVNTSAAIHNAGVQR